MPVTTSLKHLGVSRSSYFRWKQEESWKQESSKPAPPVQAFEALPEEKQAVVKYALDHPGIRHRELSWRMIDADIAYLSMSTVYRILRTENLMCLRPGRKKRYREEIEKASRPDEIWATDLMYLTLGESQYYLLNFIDEYSRYLVHWELLTSMDGHSIRRPWRMVASIIGKARTKKACCPIGLLKTSLSICKLPKKSILPIAHDSLLLSHKAASICITVLHCISRRVICLPILAEPQPFM